MALRQNLLAWMAQNLIKSSNFNDVIPAASTTANASIANDAINIRTMNRVILKNGSDYSNSFIVEPTVAGSWLVGSDEYEQKIQYDTPNNVTKLVINLNTVNNVMDYLVSKGLTGNITVGTGPSTTRSLTIAQVKEQYGDMLMYDLATLDAYTLQYQRNCEISPYGNDGIVSLNTSMGLVFDTIVGTNGEHGNLCIPLANLFSTALGNVRNNLFNGFNTFDCGQSVFVYDLYQAYYAAKTGTWAEYTSTDIPYCSFGRYFKYLYFYDKDAVDALILDINALPTVDFNIGYLDPTLDPIPVPTDPEETEPGQDDNTVENIGGTGDWTINQIDKPITPGAGASLFGNTYLLNLNQLKGISNLFFSDNAISALLTHASASEILSAFRGAMIWPFDFDDLEVPQLTAQYIKMGTLSVGNGTTTFSEINAGTTVDIDFGTLTLQNRYGGFLDYHPFTQMVIYIPFCGFKDIDPADVYGHTLHLYYLVDIESGAGKACIDVDNIPMMEYPCLLGIPISFNINNMYEKARNAVLGVVNSFTGAATMGTIDVHKDEDGKVLGIGSNPANAVTHLMGGLASTAINTAMTKTNFTSMGGVGNGVERQQPMKAYIITKTINTAVPNNYNSRFGRPSLMVKQLTEEVGKGFTTIINPQLELNCTEEEKNYILSNLQKGVYL